MKTMKDWEKSNMEKFEDFVMKGDVVGKDVVEHFRNTMIPKTDTSYLMQMGEPQNYIDGKTTYMTFENTPEGWKYKGDCYAGESRTPFEKWLDTFIDEKGLDLTEEFKSEKNGIKIRFEYKDVLDFIKTLPDKEQLDVKNILVKLDYLNKDIKDFLQNLSEAIIPSPKQVKEMEEIYGESIYGIEKEEDDEEEDVL